MLNSIAKGFHFLLVLLRYIHLVLRCMLLRLHILLRWVNESWWALNSLKIIKLLLLLRMIHRTMISLWVKALSLFIELRSLIHLLLWIVWRELLIKKCLGFLNMLLKILRALIKGWDIIWALVVIYSLMTLMKWILLRCWSLRHILVLSIIRGQKLLLLIYLWSFDHCPIHSSWGFRCLPFSRGSHLQYLLWMLLFKWYLWFMNLIFR